jgi:Domain of unknown function (DUF4833)
MIKRINNYNIWGLFLGFWLMVMYPLSIKAQTQYPTPPDKYGRLFYIQRSGNINTIVYDANFTGVKTFNSESPINAYWIRYADKGETRPLNYIQRTFAYGVSVKKSNKPNEFIFNLVSYSKKKLTLSIDSYGNPFAIMEVNGKELKLHHVFVKIEPGSMFTMAPKVNYVEIFGKDLKTGAAIYEKIIP